MARKKVLVKNVEAVETLGECSFAWSCLLYVFLNLRRFRQHHGHLFRQDRHAHAKSHDCLYAFPSCTALSCCSDPFFSTHSAHMWCEDHLYGCLPDEEANMQPSADSAGFRLLEQVGTLCNRAELNQGKLSTFP